MTEQQPVGFDLDSVADVTAAEDKGTIVLLVGPDERPYVYSDENGELRQAFIVVAGTHSSFYKKQASVIGRRKLKPGNVTSEAFRDEEMEKIAACTLSWGGMSEKGRAVVCTPQNAERVYQRASWIYDQVVIAAHDHARFFTSSSPEPSPT